MKVSEITVHLFNGGSIMAYSEDYEAGMRGDSFGADTFSYSYQMGAQERERRARSGGGFGGSSALGGGPVAVLGVILAFLGFIAALAAYPISGCLTGIAFALGTALINGGGHNTMNGVGLVFALMVPCGLIYFVTFSFELRAAASSALYRTFRLYWRLVLGTFFVHALGSAFHRPNDFGEPAPISGYLVDAVMTVGGCLLLYLNSIRLDRKYGLIPPRIALLDRLIAPLQNRLIPVMPIDKDDSLFVRAKIDSGKPVEVGLRSDGMVQLGASQFPLRNLLSVETNRDHRGLLAVCAVFLFFAGPGILKNMFGDFQSLTAQALGLSAVLGSAYLLLMSLLPKTPAGKLAGPFRFVELCYTDTDDRPRLHSLKFETASDEIRFRRALASTGQG
jgi:hypothetical protein